MSNNTIKCIETELKIINEQYNTNYISYITNEHTINIIQ